MSHATVYGSLNRLDAPLLVDNVHDPVEGSFKAAIFGFSDGITTSISLVLGVALTHQPHATVVVTGMAGLFAGASSMACGEWLGAQAEKDCHVRELEHERQHLQQIPAEEARHMKTILESYGLSSRTADAVNQDVAALPLERQVVFHGKFELGIEIEDGEGNSPLRTACTMWWCFALGALVPVLPWMLTPVYETAVLGSMAGSVAGMATITLYQVRKNYRAFPCKLVRQVLITGMAVGLTILFDAWFTHKRKG